MKAPDRSGVLVGVALALGLGIAGCGGCGEEKPEPETAAPALDHEDVASRVEAIFTAIARADCEGLVARVPELQTLEDCEQFVRVEQQNNTRLLRIERITPDGRDPGSAIVHAVIERSGRQKTRLIRATRTEDEWTFVL